MGEQIEECDIVSLADDDSYDDDAEAGFGCAVGCEDEVTGGAQAGGRWPKWAFAALIVLVILVIVFVIWKPLSSGAGAGAESFTPAGSG